MTPANKTFLASVVVLVAYATFTALVSVWLKVHP